MEKEIWKPLFEIQPLLYVSNVGNLKKGTKSLKHGASSHGYRKINLCLKTGRKTFFVHRLVAMAFIPKIEGKPEINHKNGIKTDNRVENIEWCTRRENILHCYKMDKKKRTWVKDGVLLLDTNTGIFYNSIQSACTARCIKRSTLAAWISGRLFNKSSLIKV